MMRCLSSELLLFCPSDEMRSVDFISNLNSLATSNPRPEDANPSAAVAKPHYMLSKQCHAMLVPEAAIFLTTWWSTQ